MKPGMSPNREDVILSESTAMGNASSVGMGSNQDASTTQTANRNPNRLRPAYQESGPSGMAEVERNGIMPDQTSDKTRSTQVTYAARRKII